MTTALEKIKGGSTYYLASDISDFFTNIPRKSVESQIAEIVRDEKFSELFRSAMDVELVNMAELREDAEKFPIHDIGVAQGNCLSAFVGNVLLENFDTTLNTSDVFCLRYIDDLNLPPFLVVPSRSSFPKW